MSDQSQVSNAQRLKDQFYDYDMSFGNIAASATANMTLNIQSDSNFLWRALNFAAYPHGATFATPVVDNIIYPFTVQITDSGTGRSFFSNAVAVNAICGSGKFSAVLPEPYLWRANSVIQAVLVNLDGTNQWDNVHLSFIGKKTFGTIPVAD